MKITKMKAKAKVIIIMKIKIYYFILFIKNILYNHETNETKKFI